MNILITGGAGYIGSCLAHSLVRKKHRVTLIDNLSNGYKSLIPQNAHFLKSDIADKKKINKLLSRNKFDILIHLAAFIKVDESVKSPKKYFFNNVKKSKIFIDLCLQHGLKNIIFSSTAGVYKHSKKPVTEKSKILTLSPYAKNKLTIENYLKKKSKKKKLKYIILRYFNVAGAMLNLKSGQASRQNTLIKVLSEYIVNKRKSFFINGINFSTKDGTAIRDFIHVVDLCKIHILIIKNIDRLKNSIFNCGYGKGYSVLEVFNTAKKNFRKEMKFQAHPRRKGDIESSVANANKIKKILKFHPKFNNISKIIKSSVNWEKKLLRKKIN